MKMTRIAAACFALGLSLAGCATTPILPPSAGVIALQGDTGLDVIYNTAAHAYLDHLAGMDPAVKAQAKPLLQALYRVTVAADTAERLGNAADLATEVKAAGDLYAQLKPLLHLP